MAKNIEPDNGLRNQINNGTTIKGDVITEGNIRIDGMVIGTLSCKGKLVVGPTGKIEGEVKCQSANISGEISAKIQVSELLTLQSSAKLNGDIVTNKLAIEPGARFTGSCSMGAVIKDMSQNDEKKKAAEVPQAQKTATV